MKTNKIIFLTIYLFSVLFLGCSDDTEEFDAVQEELVAFNEDEGIESSYSLLDYTPNVYWDFFSDTDNTIGFSSLNPGGFAGI